MAEKSKKYRSKRFRVAVEGATSDGRTIERQHIEEMAAGYNTDVYTARIWVEHMRSLLPDGPFRAYGTVLSVEAEEVDIGGEKKLALFAQVEPTDDLVNMVNVLKQKLFTSIEIAPKFASTGKAYLQGLAVTDSPASLGTEMLAFAAQHPDANPLTARKQAPENLFTAAAETVIDFEEIVQAPPRSTKLAGFFASLGLAPKPSPKEEPQPEDMGQFCEQILQQFNEQEEETNQLRERLAKSDETIRQQGIQLSALSKKLDTTPEHFTPRPPVTGPAGGDATDC